MIPEDKIEQVQNQIDIVEVISQYYPLKRAGKNFTTLCPFHEEKTPSFMVSPEKQIFHCFGCGKGGNVFRFLMEQEKLSFLEAVKMVAKKVGIPVEEKIISSKNKQLYSLFQKATHLFREFLDSSGGKEAQHYLAKRGVKEKTIQEFFLGYAPGGELLLDKLRREGFNSSLMEEAGILSRKENEEYPYFRRRIMFPIFNSRGNPVGFGGRVLSDALPKYLNSPESEIFEKRKIWYGLNLTRQHIVSEESALVVEGYLDLISLYQTGIRNVVASLGTALTYWQVRALRRLAKKIYIIYDPDEPGKKATSKAMELFMEQEIYPKTVVLPVSYDADAYIRKYGKEKFLEQLSKAEDIFTFHLNQLKSQHDPQTLEGKVAISEEMATLLAKIPDALRKREYVKMLAEELKTEENIVLQKVEKVGERKFKKPEQSKRLISTTPSPDELIISLMTANEHARERIWKENSLEDFQEPKCREIATVIYKMFKENREITPSTVSNYLSGEIQSYFSDIMMEKQFEIKDEETAIQHWEKKNIKKKIEKGSLSPQEYREQTERLQKLMQC